MGYKETIDKLMETVIKEGGSDLHISTGSHPIIRVDDVLIPLQTSPELKAEDSVGFLKALIIPIFVIMHRQ